MSTRVTLRRAGDVASFILAWGIVGHQVWRTQFGQEPNEWLMMFAASILAPAAIQYILASRGVSTSSAPEPSSPSASSSASESGGGS